MSIRLDHIAIAVRAIEPCRSFLERTLGAEPHHGGPTPAFEWAQWRFANGARLELIAPSGVEGFVDRHLAARGPGVHHVTLKVPSLFDAAARAREHGYEIVGYNDTFRDWKECFLHPKQAGGIVVQLAESTDDADGNRPADTDVRLDGLSLRVQSEDAARRQWQELLGATSEACGAALRLRWPQSPAYIDAHTAPDAEPGPTAIVLAAERDVAIDARTAALFGTPFDVRR